MSKVPTAVAKDSELKQASKERHPWTIVHAIFGNMGGFYASLMSQNWEKMTELEKKYTTDASQLSNLIGLGSVDVQDLSDICKNEIQRKGTARYLVWTLAVGQYLWYAASYVACWKNGLPLSSLESSCCRSHLQASSLYSEARGHRRLYKLTEIKAPPFSAQSGFWPLQVVLANLQRHASQSVFLEISCHASLSRYD